MTWAQYWRNLKTPRSNVTILQVVCVNSFSQFPSGNLSLGLHLGKRADWNRIFWLVYNQQVVNEFSEVNNCSSVGFVATVMYQRLVLSIFIEYPGFKHWTLFFIKNTVSFQNNNNSNKLMIASRNDITRLVAAPSDSWMMVTSQCTMMLWHHQCIPTAALLYLLRD